MKKNHPSLVLSLILSFMLWLNACSKNDVKPDASGSFEAVEVIVSSEASGKILSMSVQEGDTLVADSCVARVDDTQLQLRKKQLQSQISAVLSKQPDAASQLATLQEQIAVAKREKARFEMLLQAGSSTQKVVDDITGQVLILERQYEALKRSLDITSGGLRAETLPLLSQIEQTNDQIAKCRVINPINGTVLTKYAEQFEVASPGKALYKIADLSTLHLRAYIGGAQLAQIKIGQTVRVFVDNGASAYKELQGTISWVSSKAEFTPKTIQTKDERANLVYAMKVRVKNDGSLKIGMYGEVRL